MIEIFPDAPSAARLRQLARELGMSINDLAECFVAVAARDAFIGRADDPASEVQP